MIRHPIHLLAFGFGSGLAPKAPGTAGTLMAIPFFLLLCQLPIWHYAMAVSLAAILGIFICGKTASDLRVHDHSGIVWDEMVGFWITMIAIPVNVITVVAGFALFRLFDIWKPFPISWLDQHMKGGLGIMVDDIAAGALAWLCLFLICRFVLP